MQNEDLKQIVTSLITLAKSLQAQDADVFTTGAAMDTAGKITLSLGTDGKIHPNSPEGGQLVLGNLKRNAQSGSLRAAAVLLDINFQKPGLEQTEALRVIAEHQNGEAADFYAPYKKNALGQFEYAPEIEAAWTQRVFFVK